MINKLLFVAAGGAIGAVLRFGTTVWVSKLTTGPFPFGTLAVNLIGCFLIGLIWEADAFVSVPVELRFFLIAGFLGAFTTFSSYSIETFNLFREGHFWLALGGILLSNAGCILMTFGGVMLSKLIFGAKVM